MDDRVNKDIDCEEDELRYQEWKSLPRSTFEDKDRSAILKMVGDEVEEEIERLGIQSMKQRLYATTFTNRQVYLEKTYSIIS